MRSLLCGLAVVLVFVATGRAQRDCLDTGDKCREQCFTSGRYQWCGSCEYYLDCSSGNPVYQPCPPDFVWNDNAGVCAPTSPTCTQCVIPAALCTSTGPVCLNDCLGQRDGVYQWCGRCDYFLQCSGGATFYTKCQTDTLFYDDNFKACLAVSSTCFDRPCYTPDICTPNPCHNGGICHDNGDGTFWCQCPPPWSGQLCDIPGGPCTSFTCLNGGTCIQDGNSYTCECPPLFTGVHCESANYQEWCGSGLSKSNSPAANGFSIYCYFQADFGTPGRDTLCKETLKNFTSDWFDSQSLMAHGGNFGCLVSADNNPHDPSDTGVTCTNHYQQGVALGNASTLFMMVCIHFPYEGIDATAAKRIV